MRFQQAALAFVAVVVVASCGSGASAPGSTASPGVPTPTPVATPAPTPSPLPTPTASPVPTATPITPTPEPTLVPPPPPTAVRISMEGHDPGGAGYDTEITTTVTWREAVTDGIEMRVYGVTKCFAPPEGGPCLVVDTPLPASTRDLIARAPAAAGKVSWTWPAWDNVGGAVMAHGSTTYESIVVAAYNAAGQSKFIIVATGEFCPDCTY